MRFNIAHVNPDYGLIVDSDKQARRLMEMLPSVSKAAIDSETSGVERAKDHIHTLQMHWGQKPVIIFRPYLHYLRRWLTDKKPTGIFFNAKFDMWMLENEGLPWQGEVQDAYVADWLVDENIRDTDLKTRVSAVCGKPKRESWKKLFPRMNAIQACQDHYAKFINYSLADAVDTWDFMLNRKKALERIQWMEQDSLWDYFREVECPTTKVLYNMERRGVRVDVEYLKEIEIIAKEKMEQLEADFYRSVGKEINLNSPQQLKKLFYEQLKCPVQYRIDKSKGQRVKKVTTDAEALAALADMGVESAKLLLQYRALGTLKKTFITGLLQRVDATNRLHTDYQQAFAVTGRFSSRDPNLQNLPRATNDQFGIRSALIASEGMMFSGADYSQIETRLMAHLSGDPDMIKACEESDIYAAMGCKMFHVTMDFFKKDEQGHRSPAAEIKRQHSKAITLGLGFGKQAKSIAAELGISEDEAQDLFNAYFEGFPVFREFMKKKIKECEHRGYVRTILGRYRRLPEIRSSDFWKKARAERQSLNTPVQGSALDMMKMAMLKITKSGVLDYFKGHMLLTIHDELLFESPKGTSKKMMAEVVPIMKQPFSQPLKVKIDVEPYICQNYGEAK